MENHMLGSTMWAGHWLWMLIIAVIVVLPVWRICRPRAIRAGWDP